MILASVKPGVATSESLPRIEELWPDSNFTSFMRADVSGVLRPKALAKLWRLNPIIAQTEGLSEYGDDYRSPANIGPVLAEK
jgi:hypothetical protein